jgi:NDP-sugar pyrophosphorylase family protein
MKASDLFTIPEDFPFKDIFLPEDQPWDWLNKIKLALNSFTGWNAESIDKPAGLEIKGNVYIGEGVELPPFGSIQGPCYIGSGCQLRPGVYIRGNVITGKNCVLGNSCEYKNCLLFDKVETPHYNYVGDSILGTKSHLGAGAILSNLRLDQKNIRVRTPEGSIDTGLRKIGGILADGAQVGCNSTLQPGTILGKNAIVYPNRAFAGYLADNKIGSKGI